MILPLFGAPLVHGMILPNTRGFIGTDRRIIFQLKNYMYRQTVRAHNLITANSTETLPFTKEILLVWKVVSENTASLL